MKASISITLIVMGALLIMTPAVSDYFYQAHLVTLMKPPGITSVNLDGKMQDLYRIGCWLTGSGMIGIAVLCSLARHKRDEDSIEVSRTANKAA